MKLSTLLSQRPAMLHQARLANLALAHQVLTKFAARIARAQLCGAVVLKSACPEQERYCATLTAVDGAQSVLEEHFTDDDIMELADVIAFLAEKSSTNDAFRLEHVAELLLAPLRAELERAGITIDEPAEQVV